MEENENINDNDSLYEDETEGISIEEKEKNEKKTRIGNKIYDINTLNRITIVRLTQAGVKPMDIKNMLDVPKSVLYK